MSGVAGGEPREGPKLSSLEEKALEIIRSRGDEGIYQYELWKLLGLDSREGSRLALRLLKKGLIIRKPAVHNGRRTYKLYIAKPVKAEVKVDVNFGSFLEVPCFTCPNLERCYVGGFYDPLKCPALRGWLERLVEREVKAASREGPTS